MIPSVTMHEQDPADDRQDAVTRLMAENDRLRSEYRGWNAETKAGFWRQAEYIRKYQEENAKLRERVQSLERVLQLLKSDS